MKRRDFLKNSALTAAVAGASLPLAGHAGNSSNSAFFKLNYAPSLGAFSASAGDNPVDQIRFCHDQGFTAMFDNGFMGRPKAEQELIADEIRKRNMKLGPFVLYADFSKESMVLKDAAILTMLKEKVAAAIEVARRTGVREALMVPGRFNLQLNWDEQSANVIDTMRELSAQAESGGVTLVLEPLNKRDHPGLFLTGMAQSYAICRAVNSKACKIVEDFYHQQITEGNLIPNMEAYWSEIAAFHIGDNPGRREPGTGEINYQNIFKKIHQKGYKGVLCCEHGKSLKGKEGDQAFIDAYRRMDNF